MTQTLACGCSSESAQRELSNEYQHDRGSSLCVLVHWTKVASALEGLSGKVDRSVKCYFLPDVCKGDDDDDAGWLDQAAKLRNVTVL